MRNAHWMVKVGLTLGLLILADYDIGGMMNILETHYGYEWSILS